MERAVGERVILRASQLCECRSRAERRYRKWCVAAGGAPGIGAALGQEALLGLAHGGFQHRDDGAASKKKKEFSSLLCCRSNGCALICAPRAAAMEDRTNGKLVSTPKRGQLLRQFYRASAAGNHAAAQLARLWRGRDPTHLG